MRDVFDFQSPLVSSSASQTLFLSEYMIAFLARNALIRQSRIGAMAYYTRHPAQHLMRTRPLYLGLCLSRGPSSVSHSWLATPGLPSAVFLRNFRTALRILRFWIGCLGGGLVVFILSRTAAALPVFGCHSRYFSLSVCRSVSSFLHAAAKIGSALAG